MMNKYELALVYEGKITAAKKKQESEKLEKLVSAFGGKVLGQNDWGVKDLAYEIRDNETGSFIIYDLELDGQGARNLQGKLRLEEQIIRYLLVKKE
jgi:small subunit ribosomal protein S6